MRSPRTVTEELKRLNRAANSHKSRARQCERRINELREELLLTTAYITEKACAKQAQERAREQQVQEMAQKKMTELSQEQQHEMSPEQEMSREQSPIPSQQEKERDTAADFRSTAAKTDDVTNIVTDEGYKAAEENAKAIKSTRKSKTSKKSRATKKSETLDIQKSPKTVISPETEEMTELSKSTDMSKMSELANTAKSVETAKSSANDKVTEMSKESDTAEISELANTAKSAETAKSSANDKVTEMSKEFDTAEISELTELSKTAVQTKANEAVKTLNRDLAALSDSVTNLVKHCKRKSKDRSSNAVAEDISKLLAAVKSVEYSTVNPKSCEENNRKSDKNCKLDCKRNADTAGVTNVVNGRVINITKTVKYNRVGENKNV